MVQQTLKALLVSASARHQDSVSRRLAHELVNTLQLQHGAIQLHERDVSLGMPFVDAPWVNANFTASDQRNDEQLSTLAYSDSLVNELQTSDIIIIATPLYNFSVPASLKAWIDQVARVGLTFNYTTNGPVGKLTDKKAYIVIATGGTPLGSDLDFASDYLRHVLGFIGINDIAIIAAEGLTLDDEQGLQNIRSQIEEVARKAA